MPQLKREMSWLSPRRRRTTGNLRGVQNGDVDQDSSTTAPSKSLSLERPRNVHRTITQPPNNKVDADGNLFYAYARKVWELEKRGSRDFDHEAKQDSSQNDEFNSRYLLTFASAPIANEWWLLLQIHFPEAQRAGPQIFSFESEDLLAQAWKHPSFAHLKSKWMYISFSDMSREGLGGAAQGIIPIQDAQGNLLGGSASSMSDILPEVKADLTMAKNDVGKLEEYYGKMIEALEQNTQKSAELAAKIAMPKQEDGELVKDVIPNGSSSNGSYFDMDALSTHFGQLNEALTKNSQHVEDLAKSHHDSSERLQKSLEDMTSRQNEGSPDMNRLSSHLDRIQNVLEKSVEDRRDSAKELSNRAPPMDLSPLTERLERVQEAIEENSALIKKLLSDEGDASPTIRAPPQIDMPPLTESLQRIHTAIEQQSEHTKALVGFASGDSEINDSGISLQDRGLGPLSEHLEQIYGAVEEGNKHSQALRDNFNFDSLGKHFEALQENSEAHSGHLEKLVEAQNATREAVEANGELDFTPLAEHLEAIRESSETNTQALQTFVDRGVDFALLTPHLESIREATTNTVKELRNLATSQQETSTKILEKSNIDLSPLTDRLNSIHSTLERQADDSLGAGGQQKFMNALTSHLSKIQNITEQNAQHVKSLSKQHTDSNTKLQTALAETSAQVRKLTERNEKNEAKIDAQNSQMRELMSGQREMVEVMRQVAKNLVQQNKQSCDHVVIPPPRKMNRKLVGFVYDAKEGP